MPTAPKPPIFKISTGNTKTGPSVSLIAKTTCGNSMTAGCKDCYTDFGRMALSAVRDRYQQNTAWLLTMLQTHSLLAVATAVADRIKDAKVKTLRIHDSGDFNIAGTRGFAAIKMNCRYVRMWQHVVRMCPSVQFWTYTRTTLTKVSQYFLHSVLVADLIELAAEPNVKLWLSADHDNYNDQMKLAVKYPEFAGVAILIRDSISGPQDKGMVSEAVSALGKDRVISFPIHKEFGRVKGNTLVSNACPAIVSKGFVKAAKEKKLAACQLCQRCLPAATK